MAAVPTSSTNIQSSTSSSTPSVSIQSNTSSSSNTSSNTSSTNIQSRDIRKVVATRVLSKVLKYVNPKYANIPEYIEFCQHVLNVCPQGKDVLVDFVRTNSLKSSVKTVTRIVQNMPVNDYGVYPLDQYDLKYYVPTENFQEYEAVFQKYSTLGQTKLDPSKNLGMLREKVLLATTLKHAVEILDIEAPSICRYTQNVVKSATKNYPRRIAKEILGKVHLEGLDYEIVDILMALPELKIEISIPARVNAFLCLLKNGAVRGLPRNTCVPIEDVFLAYKTWIDDVGISANIDDDTQYFLEFTEFPHIYCP